MSPRIRVGFVSSHFRRHSICKLYCGIIRGLSRDNRFEVFVFSALQESNEDDTTRSIAKETSFINTHCVIFHTFGLLLNKTLIISKKNKRF